MSSNSNRYEELKNYFEVISGQLTLRNLIEEAKERLSLDRGQQESISVELHNKRVALEEKKEYEMLSNHLDNIQQLEREKKEIEDNIVNAQNQIVAVNGKISEYILKQDELRKKIVKSFEELSERYNTSNLQIKEEDIKLEGIRVFLIDEYCKYSTIEEGIGRIDQSILNEENMGIRLQKILENVRNLIEQQQLKTCPVCHTSFDDSEMLM